MRDLPLHQGKLVLGPTKAPDEKHQAPPTPKYAITHFTARWRSGNVLAASASTHSAILRCGCGKLAI